MSLESLISTILLFLLFTVHHNILPQSQSLGSAGKCTNLELFVLMGHANLIQKWGEDLGASVIGDNLGQLR